ncbi:MAG TPA: alkaline phosphatase family protein [bacterium]|nr:alkaline phosphatase family protein [bacterium]
MRVTRREFLRLVGGAGAAAGLGSLAGLTGCQSSRMRDLRQKVIIVGFDGVSPYLLEPWAEKGLLPNVRKLMRLGGYRRLGTTNPPESPVAWASFNTGCNPGKHGIFDFLRRDPKTYVPSIAIAQPKRPRFLFGLIPISPPGAICGRQGKTFWKIASEHRIRTTVLLAPVSFEPEELEGGYVLSGLGVPDLRGTQGTYHYFSTRLSDVETGDTEMGGKLVRLEFHGNVARAQVQGPWNPVLLQEKEQMAHNIARIDDRIASSAASARRLASLNEERAELVRKKAELESRRPVLVSPIAFQRTGAGEIVVEVSDRSIAIKPGQWSAFVPIKFDVTPIVSANGIARFYLESVSPQVSVYMTPINIDPTDPVLPICYPKRFSREIAERIGLFKTQGWAIDTMALNEGKLSDETFLQDAVSTFEARKRMLDLALETLPFNLLFMLFSGTDRIQHAFFRLLDKGHPLFDAALASRLHNPILDSYRRMDAVIGELLAKIGPDTTLLVLSDHAFHSFRRGVNLNTWLVRNGYMQFSGASKSDYNLEGLFGRGDFWPNVDFERTKAYSLGLGQIYINLRGREAFGTVSKGPEYRSLKKEIIARLSGLVDPKTGEVAVRTVYDRDDIYFGPAFDDAPDLQVATASNYRVSWQSTLGGISKDVFVDNDRKWSGDHCSLDVAITPGILLCNRRIMTKRPTILDLAPTALAILGVAPPAYMDGKSISLGS